MRNSLPLVNKTLIGGSGHGEGPGTSSSAQTFNPITRLRAELSLPSAVELFQYRTDDSSPDYVRLTTLDRYNGSGWSASPLSQRRDEAQVQKGIRSPDGEVIPEAVTVPAKVDLPPANFTAGTADPDLVIVALGVH